MQQLARQSSGLKFLFVDVDTLSRFLWVRPLIRKTAEACKNALREIITDIRNATPNMQPIICRETKGFAGMPPKPEKVRLTRVESLQANFHHSASKKQLSFILQTVRLNQLLRNATSARSKQSFLSVYMRIVPTCI